MAICTTQDVFNDVRSLLNDLQVSGGAVFTNARLTPLFGEPYRTMFGLLMGPSKRVERTEYVVLPANTTVLIPATMGITDFAEPEMIEERPATASVPILSTTNATPITVTTANPHGLGPNGTSGAGFVTGVSGTNAPWGNWGIYVISSTQFYLNGSTGDGNTGSGGAFYVQSQVQWSEVLSVDYAANLDGQQQSYLQNYLWEDEQLKFRGSIQNMMLRIKYYASGNPPANLAQNINIDNCRDFLVHATAGKAAQSQGWFTRGNQLMLQAYKKTAGEMGPDDGGLLEVFRNIQVMAQQRGPTRRYAPFRDKRSRFGSFIAG